jgi:hypothetical protein
MDEAATSLLDVAAAASIAVVAAAASLVWVASLVYCWLGQILLNLIFSYFFFTSCWAAV